MNAKRREELRKINDVLEEKMNEIDYLKNVEEECYDNLPESIMDSDRGEEMQMNIEAMEEAMEEINNAREKIEEIIDNS